MGLAAASALVVLIASGVAVSRLASEGDPRRHPEAAPVTGAPGSAADQGSSAAGSEVAAPAGETAAAGGALPSTSALVPPPAPARGAASLSSSPSPAPSAGSPATAAERASSAMVGGAGAGRPAGAESSTSGDPASGDSASGGSRAGESGPGDSASGGSPGDSASGGSPGHRSPPAPGRDPRSSGVLAASVSAGEGASGAVVGVGLGDSPEADVTVGTAQLVGDAPPSNGTGVGLGGRFLQPPPTTPIFPG